MTGKLYLVSTPIGNLEDITLRALRTLREVDLIACEDTRRTRHLLTHFGISTPLTSYYDEIEAKKGDALIAKVLTGLSLACVSDSGTPLVSDPGYRLVQKALSAGVDVVPVPGPSAAVTALSVSGLPSDRFLFYGFLPEKSGKRRAALEELKNLPYTIIFYESPRRLTATLQEIRSVFGERRAALARELTKVFEQILRGSVDDILTALDTTPAKGEITLLVEGCRERPAASADDIESLYRELGAEGGYSTRDLADRIATRLGLPRKQVYACVLRLQDEKGPGEAPGKKS